MPPRAAAKAVWAGLGSVLMPSTWASFSSKSGLAARNEETWCVQPPVKENRWNDRTTFFCPLYWPSVTVSPVCAGSEKSGARCPASTIETLLAGAAPSGRVAPRRRVGLDCTPFPAPNQATAETAHRHGADSNGVGALVTWSSGRE